MRVLVIIPAYNEEEAIGGVIAELKATCPDYDYVVINDCSIDGTMRVLAENGFNHINLPVNLGIGGGVQTGYMYAVQRGYDVAVQMDGDGQHDPGYLKSVVAPVAAGECDMCIGSRFVEKRGFQTSFMRRVGIRFLSFLIRISCGVRVRDTTSGFRATSLQMSDFFSRHYAQDYPEPEAIVTALTAGYTVHEVPVQMRERQGGTSSINTLKSVYYMIKVSIAILLGRAIYGKEKKNDD